MTPVQAAVRDCKAPGPNKRQRIDNLRAKYIADDSFAEACLTLIDTGHWSEVEAVAALERVYRTAFGHGTAARKPWVAEAQRLLAELPDVLHPATENTRRFSREEADKYLRHRKES